MSEYFLYARKSTDVEDKQVRSIEDQLAVLRALAKQEGLNIATEFMEKRSAKKPGRPIFNEMLNRIEKGEADGVLCWKLDRLARNPIDAARVQWLLQQNVIKHIRTNDRNYYPSDNVLMMGFEFGMANQYIRDLGNNVKRALHEKANRGEYPGVAPIGYINDARIKNIIVDKHEAALVKQAFELYAQNGSTLKDIALFFFNHGIKTKFKTRWNNKGGRPMKRDQASYILSNPIYCGLFRYAGELHEGKHKPIVTKKLFDDVQKILADRGNPHKNPTNQPQPLCGLLHCGECGRSITAEVKIKHQDNGNVHEYTYYRCTKKNIKCSQPHIRAEELDKQLSTAIKAFAMPTEWAQELSAMADRDEREGVQATAAFVQELRSKIIEIDRKRDKLLEGYISELIEPDRYREEKNKLTSEKKTLAEKITRLEQTRNVWLEPLRNWIKDAQTLNEIDETTPVPLKKSFAQKIFGSNLFLKNQKIEFIAKTQYAELGLAYGKRGEFPTCRIVVEVRGIEPRSQKLFTDRLQAYLAKG